MISNDDWKNPNHVNRMLADIEYLESMVKKLKKIADVAELVAATNAERIRDLEAENARLRSALKDAIPWACLKCTLWNSRAARCSLGSGMCDQVWTWKTILGEAAK